MELFLALHERIGWSVCWKDFTADQIIIGQLLERLHSASVVGYTHGEYSGKSHTFLTSSSHICYSVKNFFFSTDLVFFCQLWRHLAHSLLDHPILLTTTTLRKLLPRAISPMGAAVFIITECRWVVRYGEISRVLLSEN